MHAENLQTINNIFDHRRKGESVWLRKLRRVLIIVRAGVAQIP